MNTDISSLLLKYKNFQQVPIKDIVQQIEAKKKCQKKLPTWFSAEGIYYPQKLSIEQTSSETTAQYKANLVNGKTLIDLTGGFGVDSYFFAKQMEKVIHCELDLDLSKVASHNYKILDQNNIETTPENGLEFLQKSNQKFDWIYLDPARRNDQKGKVFLLSDCLPNVPENLDLLFEHSDNVLIKTAPLLDITNGIDELTFVKSIHVIAVNNEVKELLWVLQKEFEGDINIETVNLKSDKEEKFLFLLKDEQSATASYAMPKKYVYEPNAAILKSGAFKMVGNTFRLEKLHQHSHLYTSDTFLADFPGRIFQVDEILSHQGKNLKKRLKDIKTNVTTRNYPESVENLRRKYKMKDGGDTYVFFTTACDHNKVVLVCSRLFG